MKKPPWRSLLPYVLVAVAAGGLVRIVDSAGRRGSSPRTSEVTGSIPHLIETTRPVRRTFSVNIAWTGVVRSTSALQVRALVAGRVDSVVATDQSPVKAGTTLMILGGPQIASARAGLQGNLRTLEARLKVTSETVARLRDDVSARIATRDQLASALDLQLDLQGRVASVRQAIGTFQQESRITATATGVFTGRRVSAGQSVGAGDVVGDIVDPSHVRIEATVYPPEAVNLVGTVATVEREDGTTLAARVSRVLPLAGPGGGTRVWIEGSALDGNLLPGRAAAGHIVLRTDVDALAVPRSAIVFDEQERPCVFVASDSLFTRVAVTIGPASGAWVEILSGLTEGTDLVSRGSYELLFRDFSRRFKVVD